MRRRFVITIALAAILTAPSGALAYSPGTARGGIVAGPDGNIWAGIPTGALYKVTTSGQITPANSGGMISGELASGPNGDIWASVVGFGAGPPGIAEISPLGPAFVFAPYQVAGLTVGPDGNIWFTSGLAGTASEVVEVSRIASDGQVTSYPIPVSLVPGLDAQHLNEVAPLEIASGDGALWMLTYNGLIRMTTDGQMTFLPIPNTGGEESGLTYGPDGNLWATYGEYLSGLAVRRITRSGQVTAIPLPPGRASGEEGGGITGGPDGNIWVANGSRILRITPAGGVTECPTGLPASSPAEGITTGPDGNLWFRSLYAIGRITTSCAVTNFPLPGNTGKPPVYLYCVVPTLKGESVPEVRRQLARAHCQLGHVSRSARHTARKSVVLRQKPAAKTVRPQGTRVSVVLSGR